MGGKCDYPVCPGSHHKFSDCRTEALYVLSVCAGMFDDGQTGSVEWSTHTTLFCFTESAQFDRADIDMAFDVYFEAGTHYLIHTNDQGFVWPQTFGSKVEAENAFNELDQQYSAWLDS